MRLCRTVEMIHAHLVPCVAGGSFDSTVWREITPRMFRGALTPHLSGFVHRDVL